MTQKGLATKLLRMFVSVIVEMVNDDNEKTIENLLLQYGFKRVLKNAYESTGIMEKYLSRLKRDIDRRTDFYDTVRIYQYPIDDTLVITTLREKKWKRTVLRA